jgi:hypothetical protein
MDYFRFFLFANGLLPFFFMQTVYSWLFFLNIQTNVKLPFAWQQLENEFKYLKKHITNWIWSCSMVKCLLFIAGKAGLYTTDIGAGLFDFNRGNCFLYISLSLCLPAAMLPACLPVSSVCLSIRPFPPPTGLPACLYGLCLYRFCWSKGTNSNFSLFVTICNRKLVSFKFVWDNR